MVVHSHLVPFVCVVCYRRGDTKGILHHVYLALSEVQEGYVAYSVRLGRCTLTSKLTHYRSMRSFPKTATVPVHLLRSGWDHDLDLRSPVGSFRSKRFSLFKMAESTRASTPSPPPPEDEAMFTQSTLDYLASDRAQQLRLPSPPPAVRLQNYATHAFSPTPMAATNGDPILSASPNGSFFPADTWLQPSPTRRSSVSPRASATIADPRRPSSPLSTRSSLGSTIIDALGAIPAHLRDAPFNVNGPGVTAVPDAQGPRGPIQHRTLVRKGSKKPEGVYMTVVHETVAGP
jgi:hypothetical protein